MVEPLVESYYASEIKEPYTNTIMTLSYIGSGTTCNVYKTSSKNVVKEFAPLINGKPAMVRKNNILVPRDGLTPFELGIINERRVMFDSEISLINELNDRYKQSNDNMFLIPVDMQETSIGRCHWCNYIGGKTLHAAFEESRQSSPTFQHHFLNVLPLIISLFDEIAFYHEVSSASGITNGGVLNLDIKPQNLFSIKSQGEYIGIRNLDFGSIKRLHDSTSSDGEYLPGLITSIRNYAKNHYEINRELIINQIAAKYFVSSPGFYDKDRINSTIDICLSSDNLTDIVSDLKLLDILAALKTFLCALGGSDDLFVENEHIRWKTENDLVFEAFSKIFENHRLGNNNSLFESYNIYSQLYEIMARSFKGKRKFRLTASEIADRLRNILCVLNGGIPNNKKTQEQREFEAMNRIFSQKDELLESHGLKTIRDILDYCSANGLKKPEKIGDLHWFLMFGEKHANYI